MNIVITNDDGYGEPGLVALLDAVSPLGRITIVAPKTPQSSCGHRVNLKTPIKVESPSPHHYVVNGSPADCTRLAIKELAPDADWVIAGINLGANLGSDVYQSGTVAAAREAAILGVRAISISQYVARGWTPDWQASSAQAAEILSVFMNGPLAAGRYWNINLPSPITPSSRLTHVQCPIDRHPHHYRFVRDGETYQYQGIIHDRPRAAGTDVDICFSGKVSATCMEI